MEVRSDIRRKYPEIEDLHAFRNLELEYNRHFRTQNRWRINADDHSIIGQKLDHDYRIAFEVLGLEYGVRTTESELVIALNTSWDLYPVSPQAENFMLVMKQELELVIAFCFLRSSPESMEPLIFWPAAKTEVLAANTVFEMAKLFNKYTTAHPAEYAAYEARIDKEYQEILEGKPVPPNPDRTQKEPPTRLFNLRPLVYGVLVLLLGLGLYALWPNAKQEATVAQAETTKQDLADAQLGIFTNLYNDMVWVKGGEFTMGYTREMGDYYSDEKPSHTVYVDGFYMGKYEVTQEEWQAVMGTNPSDFNGCPRCPVENVSWDDCQRFITNLNQLLGTDKYRLPTEAEWEYAARGGPNPDGTMYAGSDDLSDVGWYDGNSSRTRQVGQLRANGAGLHDMSGNVKEWCADIYAPYRSGYIRNPRVTSGGSNRVNRVNRGGSWFNHERVCRVSARFWYTPSDRDNRLGFRLLRER